MRDPGPALSALVVALVLVSSPLLAGREAVPLRTPPLRPAPALFPLAEGTGVLLTRVYANAARDDEFVEIGNAGYEAIDMSGWSLTDGEARSTFPLDAIIPPASRLVVTRNSTSYTQDTLAIADFTFDRGDARPMEGGVLRLADTGDEIRLIDATGGVADAYLWGESSDLGVGWMGRPADAMGRGQIAVRASDRRGGWVDTDSAQDWEGFRRYRLGQSGFAPEAFEIRASLTAVLSPDAGDVPLLSFLSSARDTIDVTVYTFTSESIASLLADQARRGVRVRVLLDASPVGGVEDSEHRIIGGLLEADVEVRWLTGGNDVVKRYRYLHAKYVIVDGRAAWIGSENFGDAGFPRTAAPGIEVGPSPWKTPRLRGSSRRCSKQISIRVGGIRLPPSSSRGFRFRVPPNRRRGARRLSRGSYEPGS